MDGAGSRDCLQGADLGLLVGFWKGEVDAVCFTYALFADGGAVGADD